MRHWTKTYGEGVPAEINPDHYASVPALLDEAVAAYRDKPAFICFGQTLTYGDLEAKSRAVAAYLQNRLGVKRGDRIAVMIPNSFAFPIAMLGVLRAGAAQVNVNPLYTPRELQHQLNDAGVETILIFGGSSKVLAEVVGETPVKNVVIVDLGDGAPDSAPGAIPSPPADPRLTDVIRFADMLTQGASLDFTPVPLTGDDLIYLQYTGGTTGLSKGAMLSHRNLVANTEQYKAFMPEALTPGEEVVLGALPLYHIFGLMIMVSYLSVGGRMVLIPNPRDLDGMIDAIKDVKLSIVPAVNTMFAALAASPRFKEIDLSNYKVAIGGGAAVLPATSERWKALTGHHIKEGYGLSETSPVLSVIPLSVTEFTQSCGLPVPSTDIRLLDDDDNDAPLGEAGEICAKGPQVMSGYWKNEEANAKVFTKDGYFRTGDVGIFDDAGFLRIVDRKKDMIIVSGFNVYPNEIEAVVAGCPGVVECACIGVPHEKSGETVRLCVVKEEGSDLTDKDLIAFCRERLAAYKTPRQVRFMKELPKSNVGKILRRELRDMA